jgi:hypothetical protein
MNERLSVILSIGYRQSHYWLAGCIPTSACKMRHRLGCTLTSLFENTGIPAVPAIDAQPHKKRSWLPLLTVLFLISYGLMTMLIVEQGATIESQRALIRELFRDSTELSAMKIKVQQEVRAANPSAKTQAPSTQAQSNQAPSIQAPSNQVQTPSSQMKQAPSSQMPSTQAPQRRALNQTDKQKQFQMPSRPASDLADARRELRTI